MKMYLKFLSGIIIAFLVIQIVSVNVVGVNEAVYREKTYIEEYECISENDNLILYADTKTARIAVQDKSNGNIWYSNPVDAENDKIAAGANKMVILSQLLVEYSDNMGKSGISNSHVSCVTKKGIEMEKKLNGITIQYNFLREGFSIPIEYTLCNDFLSVKINTAQIVERGENRIISISLLPYFGAGGVEDKGYMLVPDGTGALINFNNDKEIYKAYKQPVYGFDSVIELLQKKIKNEIVRMPVFGLKKWDNAILGVVNHGEGIAVINSFVSKMISSYNNIYCEFMYRASDTKTLMEKDWQNKRSVKMFSNNPTSLNYLEVQYYFLDGENADYNGMARKYREHLIKEKGLTKKHTKTSLYLDLYGAVKKRKSILGLTFDVTIPLTAYKQAEEIVSKLKASGVQNMIIRYNGCV